MIKILQLVRKKKTHTYSYPASKKRRWWGGRRIHVYIVGLIGTIPSVLFTKRLIRVIILFALFCIIVVAVRYFLFSSKFSIESVELRGNSQLSDQFIMDNLNSVIGQNIFLIRSSKMREDLQELSPYIRDIRVEKELPNNIILVIEERKSYMLWVNFTGAYLMDTDGLVLDIVEDFKDLELVQEDIDLLKGYGNLQQIRKEEEEKSSKKNEQDVEEQIKKEDNEGGNSKETLEILESRQNEIVSKVDNFWRQNLNKVRKEYKSYPFIYSYDSQKHVVHDLLDSSIVNDTKLGVEISYLKEDVVRYIWESQFRFVILLTEGRKIVFSTRRDFQQQVDDLNVLITELKKQNRTFNFIDLSSKVIPVEE